MAAKTPRPKSVAALDRYNARRHFEITAEPKGRFEKRRGRSPLRFVIQQHDARRMHFDFRLELDGVLKSWAIPKGPSLSAKEKRLAVEVEDHPIDYRGFEGIIPEGQYGGGSVIVWDEGTWEPSGDPQFGLSKGHLSFSLAGQKTNGAFSLVRIRNDRSGTKKTNWLLIKTDDEFARADTDAEITLLMPESIHSGLTVQQMAKAPAPAVWDTSDWEEKKGVVGNRKAVRQSKVRKSTSRMPALIELKPQLATLVDSPPSDRGFVYEIKFDGYRALSSVVEGVVQIRSRNALDWTSTFPPIAAELAALKLDNAILDGEICFIDADGKSSFQGLQNVMGTRGHRKVATDDSLIYYVFDLLWLNGQDLRKRPLLDRKAQLAQILKGKKKSVLQFSEHAEGDLRASLTQACGLGLEGLIVKKSTAPYEESRSRSWLKLKCGKRQEFVIVGFIEPQGSRHGFRSLLLGLHEKGKLRYVGKVGTGFNEQALKDIRAALKRLIVETPPVENPPREKGLRWVAPSMACEVSFTEMTRDGSLRHPSFQGLRQDKAPRQISREQAVSPPKGRRRSAERDADATDLDGIIITHPDRVIDATSGLTKGDLANYFHTVADWFLPFATDRPMALVRCPQGGANQCFFQKNAMPGLSKDVQRGKAAGQGILSVRSAKGLYELVQFNAMEFHGWGASKPNLTKPDWIIFDLDPDESLPFSVVIEAALEIRDALDQLGLKSFVKTTGGKGLHVTVPIKPRHGWAVVKGFTKRIAETLAAQRPDRYVMVMTKAKRKGKIFIDYLRNGEGATAVLPYSSRARPGATVAVPIAWKDLKHIEPGAFRVKNVGQWLGKRRIDPWAAFWETAQELPELN